MRIKRRIAYWDLWLICMMGGVLTGTIWANLLSRELLGQIGFFDGLYQTGRIWDEGEGFTKEDLPHLFERFYRGEKTENTGIGIGLSLSKAIIEMQNGIIRAFNLPNGGACFEVRFYIS